MTNGPILPFVPCTHTIMYLSSCHQRIWARPSVWCSLKSDSSVIECRQWWVAQIQWRLTHWWRCGRWIKVSLGHHAGLREWYPAARRRMVVVRIINRWRPVQWIIYIYMTSSAMNYICIYIYIYNWAFNLGLDINLFAPIILSNHRPFQGVEILRRWPKGF